MIPLTYKFLSQKQIESFQDSTARINIFEGPVRAGKSFIALLRWIEFCRSGPPGPLIICGRTDKTIKRNIINPLQSIIGSAVQYSIGKGEVRLYDRLMYVVGANDERASTKIQGSEFAGALIDEFSLMPESFVKMLLSRLSIKGAQLFGSTNPDSPYHWLKTDFIDRKEDLDCKVFSYSIEDNPSLDEEYKKQLKREYQGLWYKRYIEGLWVVAEGAVYDFFNERDHIIDHPPGPATKYFVGIDYGTQNPCVFVLLGYNAGMYPNIWCEKEYYYDAKKTMRQKSDYEYSQDFIKFLDGIYPEAIYIDPSAASFKVELRRQGVVNLRDAVNDVMPGIRFQGQLLSNGTYKICSQCTETIKEYSNYLWDEKAAKTGDEKPMKKYDHACVTGDTEVETENGLCRIDSLVGKTGMIRSMIRFNNFSSHKDNPINKEFINCDKYYETVRECFGITAMMPFYRVRLTGENKPVFKITLQNGFSIKATHDHEFYLSSEYSKNTELDMCYKKKVEELDLSSDVVVRTRDHFLGSSRIVKIEEIGKEDVFCLTVPSVGNFIANGIAISNCDAQRYVLFSQFFGKSHVSMTEAEANKMEDEYSFKY